MIPTLVLVGGFLGAGKTTLILKAASMLRDRGLRVAVITNDQDSGLVDTRASEAQSLETREVAGGCFCCRFSDLLEAAGELKQFAPDVIFAEPVGSCVDLSATIVQPLKSFYPDTYRTVPLTVLVDPAMAASVYAGQEDESVAYLFRKQVAEADILCLTKSDRYESNLPVDYRLSAVTGEGIAEWLDDILHGTRMVGGKLLEVDYQQYAEAEAALGWVNVQLDITLKTALSPAMLLGPLIDDLDRDLSNAAIRIAHLKAFDRCATGVLKVSLCRNGEESVPDGDLAASPALHHQVAINLRALGDPDALRRSLFTALDKVNGQVTILHESAFRPAAPRPEFRFRQVVKGREQPRLQ